MLALKGVSKTYSGSLQVLQRVDLDLRQGEFLYLIGGTGVGKTSLLRMIATQESPSEGSVSLFGFDVNRVTPRALRGIRQSIGYIPQRVDLIGDLSVYENVLLAARLAGRKAPARGMALRQRIVDLLDRLGLADKQKMNAAELSGGEAQRVAVAQALIRTPKLIIADEPTGAQDANFAWSLMDLFIKANRAGATLLLATHDREIVRRVRKRCALIKEGRVQVEGQSCPY